MDDRRNLNSPIDRANRRGCFIVAAVLLLVVAAIAFVGFNGDRIDDFKSSIPVLGALAVGLRAGGPERRMFTNVHSDEGMNLSRPSVAGIHQLKA